MSVSFLSPKSINRKEIRVKVKEIGKSAVFVADIKCFNELLKIVYEDRNGNQYTKLYHAESPINLSVGQTCWLSVEYVQDEVNDVWPKVIEVKAK